MKNPTKNRTAEISVKGDYTTTDGNTIVYSAKVIVTNIYEIEKVSSLYIEAYDSNGESIEIELSESVIHQIETLAGVKALEKVQPEDFMKEASND